MPLKLTEKQLSRHRRDLGLDHVSSSSLRKSDLAFTASDATAKGPSSPTKRSPRLSEQQSDVATARALFIFGCLIGHEVEAVLRDGSRYRGVLYTAVPEEGVVLRFAESVGAPSSAPAKSPVNHSGAFAPFLVVRRGDLLSLHAKGVSFRAACGARERSPRAAHSSASSGAVATDLEISGSGSEVAPRVRDLVAWSDDKTVPDASDPSQRSSGELGRRTGRESPLESLDRYPRTKWDQFLENERKFGVRTTYTEEHYTTKLDVGRFTEADVARAARLAAEIESKAAENPHVAEERGQLVPIACDANEDDEELRYGAVVRAPERSPDDSKAASELENALLAPNSGASATPVESAVNAADHEHGWRPAASCVARDSSVEPGPGPRRNISSASLSRNSSSEYLLDHYDVEHKRVLHRLSNRQRVEDNRAGTGVYAGSGSTSPALGAGSERASPVVLTTPGASVGAVSTGAVALGRDVASLNLELSVPQVRDEVARKMSEFKAQQYQLGYESERSRERETDSFRRFSAEIERKTSSGNLRSMIRAGSGTSLAGTENSFAVEAPSEESERDTGQLHNWSEKSGSQQSSSPNRKALDPNAKEFHLRAEAKEFVPAQNVVDPGPYAHQRFSAMSPATPHRGRSGRPRFRGMGAPPREDTFVLPSGGVYYSPGMGAVYPPMQPYASPYFFPYGPQPVVPPSGFAPMSLQSMPSYSQMPQTPMQIYPNQFASPADFGTMTENVITSASRQESSAINEGSFQERPTLTNTEENRGLKSESHVQGSRQTSRY
ncbi:Ataxin 2-like [Cyanidiococcus yangmingshanensis]|uniref:Ataxin 2-like n=1 Tax=Cyanidiococcus yangmingshanensis TaxID=2690220 RepID=A0A7J7IHM8_9RHOD|nr:Ataxin 2-like [Cyanidiococcus yangmingshanensis]